MHFKQHYSEGLNQRSGCSRKLTESQCETLQRQLFDPGLLHLWRTGANFLGYTAEEDTSLVSYFDVLPYFVVYNVIHLLNASCKIALAFLRNRERG